MSPQKKSLILHNSTAVQIFISMYSMPTYGKILLANSDDKPYRNFLNWLVESNLLIDDDERISIKNIAERYQVKLAKVTEGIKNIYDDIFTLKFERPELFYTEGIKVFLGFRHYDNYCLFKMSLPMLSREFEQIDFYFLNAKLGSSTFWVKKVKYNLENDTVIPYLFMESGFPNKYRKFTLDRHCLKTKLDLSHH